MILFSIERVCIEHNAIQLMHGVVLYVGPYRVLYTGVSIETIV